MVEMMKRESIDAHLRVPDAFMDKAGVKITRFDYTEIALRII